MKYRRVAKKLKALGCEELPGEGKGSHRKWYNPLTKQAAVIPFRRGKDLKTPTLQNALRQLQIDWEDFDNP